jgi:putative ABC transport system permease protein
LIDLSLALRNLLRNRRRSLATFLALAIGTSSILFFGGFRKCIEYTMHTAYVRAGGHLQIQHRDLYLYGSGNPTKYAITGHERLIEAIVKDPVLGRLVTIASPTLQFGGIASNFDAGVSRTVFGLGLVATDRNRMRAWNEFELPVLDPRFELDGAPPDAAIVGLGVARVLLLCKQLKAPECPVPVEEAPTASGESLPADIAQLAAREAPKKRPIGADAGGAPRLELLATSPGGAPNVVSLQVIHTERQGFKEVDEVFLVLHLQQAQRLIFGRAGTPKATAITLQLVSSGDIPNVRGLLTDLLAREAPAQPLAVLDFRELNPFFVQTVQMFDMIFSFVFALIAVIVLFTVGNTMSTAVMERTVEIGTIRALGVRRRGVQQLFILEGLLLGIAGAVSGLVFALVVSAIVNRLGLTWVPPGSADHLPLLMLVWGETATILSTTLGLIAIAGLSAWLPARRAARLIVVEALRHV